MSEQDLNNKEFENIYRTYYKKMFGRCMSYVHNPTIAEDLLQDAFIIIINKLPTLKDKTKVEPWIAAIVKNTAINYLRKKSIFSNISIDQTVEPTTEDDDSVGNKDDIVSYDTIRQMIEKLPEGYKEVFKLAVLEGMSHKEIADKLKILPTTSASQLSRAKKALKVMLSSYWSLGVVSLLIIIFFMFKFYHFETFIENNNSDEYTYNTAESYHTSTVDSIQKSNSIKGKRKILTEHSASVGKGLNYMEDTSFYELFQSDKEITITPIDTTVTNEMSLTWNHIDTIFSHVDTLHRHVTKSTDKDNEWLVGLDISSVCAGKDQSNGGIIGFLKEDGWSMENNARKILKQTKYHLPITVVLSAKKMLSKCFSVDGGLSYTFLKTEYLYMDNDRIEDNFQYLGIKNQLAYHYYSTRRFNSYIAVGGTFETPIYSKRAIKFASLNKTDHISTHCQFSVGFSMGLCLKLNKRISFTIEPTLNYFFDNGDKVVTYRSINRWNVNLPIGLSIRL
ncbi:MAG: RNA polymerase sigma factor [Bacteroidales bacterium]